MGEEEVKGGLPQLCRADNMSQENLSRSQTEPGDSKVIFTISNSQAVDPSTKHGSQSTLRVSYCTSMESDSGFGSVQSNFPIAQSSSEASSISFRSSVNSLKEFQAKVQSRCANIKLFTMMLCILSCINGAIAASYLPAVITTIEQQFHFDSVKSGLIVSSYEIGAVIATILVSYLGPTRHIPIILSIGTLFIGLGSAVFSLPHFLKPLYTSTLIDVLNTSYDDNSSYCSSVPNRATETCSLEPFQGTSLYIALFVLGQNLLGVGSAPILTIGLTYIDNHVSKKISAQYISFVYSATLVGAVMGYGLGAVMLEIYIDILRYTPSMLGLEAGDKKWLGAWWAGFLLFALLMLLISPWFCAFPKSIRDFECPKSRLSAYSLNKSNTSESSTSVDNVSLNGLSHYSIKDLPRAFMRLLRNPIYMLVNIGSVFDIIVVTGFITFAPKYLETQFNIKPSYASITAGSIAVPGAVIGVVSLGIFAKKQNLTVYGHMKCVLVMNSIACVCFAALFFIGCSNQNVAGITTPYSRYGGSEQFNLTDSCNSMCFCDDGLFNPVCHGTTVYLSYCHAGCSELDVTQPDQCSCLRNKTSSNSTQEVNYEPLLKSGFCTKNCNLFPIYLVFLFILSFSLGSGKVPITQIVLRCVDDDLKSFGLGIQVVLFRLLGYLPAPILYGAVIDTCCLWWKKVCGQNSNCLLPDNFLFRTRFHAVSIGFHILATIAFISVYVLVKRNHSVSAGANQTSENQDGTQATLDQTPSMTS